MYSTAFWCLFVVLLVFLALLRNRCYSFHRTKRRQLGSCTVDCKTVGFFFKISKEIGKAWRKSLMRAKRTDCPFSIQRVRSDQGVKKCPRAVKNLFTAPPSL